MNSTENPQNSQFGHLPDPSTQQGGLSSQNMDQRRPSNGGEDLQNQREGQNGQENRNTLQREEQPISDYDRPVFSEKNWFRFKALLVVGGMAANIAVRFALPDDNVDCILDKTHGYLGFANSYLNNNTSFALYFKIFYNAVLDINIVTVMIHWVFFSQGWQYIFDLAVFFVVRFFCTHLIAYRDPEGIIWPESSIISISGTKQSDLQYQVSAFTGVAMINFLYWIQQNRKINLLEYYKFSILSGLCIVLSIFVELSYRISYCTDLFAACLIAHLFHIANSSWVPYFDKMVNSRLVKYWTIRKWSKAPNGGELQGESNQLSGF